MGVVQGEASIGGLGRRYYGVRVGKRTGPVDEGGWEGTKKAVCREVRIERM